MKQIKDIAKKKKIRIWEGGETEAAGGNFLIELYFEYGRPFANSWRNL